MNLDTQDFVIQFICKNDTNSKQIVHLFSEDQDIPEGVTIEGTGNPYEYYLRNCKIRPYFSYFLRLQTTDITQLYNNIIHRKPSENDGTSVYEICPIAYASEHTFCENIIDIIDDELHFDLNGDQSLELLLNPKITMTLSLFIDRYGNTKRESYKPIKKLYYPFRINNASEESIKVCLPTTNDLNKNVTIELYRSIHPSMNPSSLFSKKESVGKVSVVSKNQNQLTYPIRDMKEDVVVDFLTNEINRDMNHRYIRNVSSACHSLSLQSSMIVEVEPQTEVLYIIQTELN